MKHGFKMIKNVTCLLAQILLEFGLVWRLLESDRRSRDLAQNKTK